MESGFKDLATVRVVKHLPMRLGIETENGEQEIVRVREISWDNGRSKNWKQNYPVDWSGKAYPLSAQKGLIKEYSLRVAENDPWERIFEADYTTRADGSRIDLYISWNLMEELGVRIYVKESHILSGTTFSLEIPYHL